MKAVGAASADGLFFHGRRHARPRFFGPSYRPSDTTESLFMTMPEQLGLELEPKNGHLEIIVVDGAEKPIGSE
jgi:uncharacterized protein (TIGR03435 family)